MTRSILFVDSNTEALRSMQGLVQSMRPEWCMVFAPSGTEAMEAVRCQPFHAVVSAMALPGMDGGEVLLRVRELQPAALRIALTRPEDSDCVVRNLPSIQQALAQPQEANELVAMVENAGRLGGVDAELQATLGRIGQLPSVPKLYEELVGLIHEDQANIRRVGEILRQDMAMTVRILQLVNSAFFGLRRSVEDIHEAVHFLGIDTIKALVLADGVFEQGQVLETRRITLGDIWQHSLAVARGARALAAMEGLSRHARADAFLGGLLHDVGILLLARQFPARYDRALGQSMEFMIPLPIAERAEFGTSHQEVGAYLLGLWGIQASVLAAVSHHHNPGRVQTASMNPVLAIHLADLLCSSGMHPLFETLPMDEQTIDSLGLRERIPGWRQVLSQPGW